MQIECEYDCGDCYRGLGILENALLRFQNIQLAQLGEKKMRRYIRVRRVKQLSQKGDFLIASLQVRAAASGSVYSRTLAVLGHGKQEILIEPYIRRVKKKSSSGSI
jgi:hypothetical protein